jgi:hypothetical protein
MLLVLYTAYRLISTVVQLDMTAIVSRSCRKGLLSEDQIGSGLLQKRPCWFGSQGLVCRASQTHLFGLHFILLVNVAVNLLFCYLPVARLCSGTPSLA